ncbi:hypothetical protein M3I54_35860 [Paraburkholderia sp. CNPSo 3274]|uniref:hypothetical protein n=1 Tax=Paraburkholderia sp. CNPSo 3274 TaxID=2940932 RepID=UPI0020B79075|nr:hypothetical protein [Paraburkholderia sp. CNPSo 3274]MCP3712259.1 hypothetical protein [Paraburkholderia sp. CNPSo 3274]
MNADQLRDRLLTLRFELRRLFGLPGFVGILMIVAAALMCAEISSVEADTKEMQAPAHVAQAAKTRHAAGEHGAEIDTVALEAWPELFPRFSQSADDIASIFEQARGSNLTLGSAEYQVSTDAGARFTRYQVMLPVKDQYSAIRHFLALVLNNVPNAALREIHVERPAVDGNILDARVRFELIYRSAQP